VFDELYFPESSGYHFLHCNNVWFSSQLPWNYQEAANNRACLFSVIQSSSGLSVNTLYSQYQLMRKIANE
jgi:hypothetical protein